MRTNPRHSIIRGAVLSKGFTLIELLTVVAIMLIMMALIVPAFTGIKGGRDITKAAYDISGILEQARTYAMANNTYVWVGFYEEAGTPGTTSTPGIGRVVVSVTASKDGTRYSDTVVTSTTPGYFGKDISNTSDNKTPLFQLNKLVKLDNVHLGTLNNTLNTNNSPDRPGVPVDYQVGDDKFGQRATVSKGVKSYNPNPTYFTYPLAVPGTPPAAQYTFTKIIEFNAQGEASKIAENTFSGSGPQNAIEVALQPAHGTVIEPSYAGTIKAAAAIQVEGITGRVQMFRP